MSISAIKFSKELFKYLTKYGPIIIEGLPDVWKRLTDFIGKKPSGEKEALVKELAEAQKLYNDAQQQLAQTVQALETAVRQRAIYRNLSWILGTIAVICFAVAMWAIGRIS
jgi:hypothetical protein